MFEEAWNYGFPQEMRHFIDCVQHSGSPLEDGDDGRAVLEIIYAMYRAASSEARVDLPLELSQDEATQAPISGWRR
jgi:myo-inositol 2-dehydrogenase/D-chiro-inositol 1-dehydrogenase